MMFWTRVDTYRFDDDGDMTNDVEYIFDWYSFISFLMFCLVIYCLIF